MAKQIAQGILDDEIVRDKIEKLSEEQEPHISRIIRYLNPNPPPGFLQEIQQIVKRYIFSIVFWQISLIYLNRQYSKTIHDFLIRPPLNFHPSGKFNKLIGDIYQLISDKTESVSVYSMYSLKYMNHD